MPIFWIFLPEATEFVRMPAAKCVHIGGVYVERVIWLDIHFPTPCFLTACILDLDTLINEAMRR